MSNWKTPQERADSIRNQLRQEVGSSTMDLINELVEVELLLEEMSNQ